MRRNIVKAMSEKSVCVLHQAVHRLVPVHRPDPFLPNLTPHLLLLDRLAPSHPFFGFIKVRGEPVRSWTTPGAPIPRDQARLW
jgi:hypothetical protein